MGLTKIRAGQISNIDYKQSCRVLTDSNLSLSGGAPSLVDNVSLMINDRVLVTGQDDKTENGLYRVSVLGTGADGTWVRTSDTDTAGELEAGAIVMVTEGTVYQDTQWKLITNDPIVIGVSELIFEQNSAFAFGNIAANGTAVLANTVGDAVTFTAGDNISITGNNTTKTVTFAVTGISLNSIANGTSNVDIAIADGNVTTTVDGNTTFTVTSTGANSTGYITATGNVTGGNLITDGLISAGTTITATGNILGGNLVTANQVVATGNILGGNLVTANQVVATGNILGGNLVTANQVVALGNITGDNILGNGAGLTGINVFSVIAVTGQGDVVADSISDTLTLAAGSGIAIVTDAGNDIITIAAVGTGGSIFATGGSMGTVDEAVTSQEDLGLVTEGVVETYDLGTLGVDGVVTNQNIVDGSLTGNKFAPDTDLATTGNLSVGNLTVTGALGFDSIAANGLSGPTGNISVSANLIPSANITYDLGSASNAWKDLYLSNSTIYLGEATIRASGADILLPSTIQIGEVTLTAEGNTLALPENIAATAVTVSGNISSGNISSGNISSGNIAATGNVTGGNLTTTGLISAAGNATVSGQVTGGLFVSPRTISANTTIGNINAMSTGPITIGEGVTVTVSPGGDWSIV